MAAESPTVRERNEDGVGRHRGREKVSGTTDGPEGWRTALRRVVARVSGTSVLSDSVSMDAKRGTILDLAGGFFEAARLSDRFSWMGAVGEKDELGRTCVSVYLLEKPPGDGLDTAMAERSEVALAFERLSLVARPGLFVYLHYVNGAQGAPEEVERRILRLCEKKGSACEVLWTGRFTPVATGG